MALNFYRYKTFVTFKSVTFEIFLKIVESVGDDAKSVFHEDQNFSKVTLLKVTQFLSLSKVSLLKFSENAQKVLILMPIMICRKI